MTSLPDTRDWSADPALDAVRRRMAVIAVLSAMALVVLDAGVTNVALPTLGAALGATPAAAMLVVTAYQAGVVMALLPFGALGERFGHRHVFTAGVWVFAAGAAASALATSLPWLVAARFVQGLGGAAIMGLGLALLRFAAPPGRLGAAIGWNALTVALASAAGPSLGALLLSVASWPWIFAAGLPLAGLALAASRALPATRTTAAPPDLSSMALNAAAFGLLILGAQSVSAHPRLAAVLLGAGAASMAGLVRREWPKAEPLLPLDLLRAPSFRLSAIASVFCFAAQSAGLLALPFLLQHRLGQSPLATGACITAWPLGVAVTAMLAGRLADHVATARLCAAGGGLMAAGLAGLAARPLGSEPPALVPFILLAGMGFGLFQSPNNRNLLMAAPPSRSGAAGGLQGSARLTGQAVGVLLMSGLFARLSLRIAPDAGLAIAAVLAVLAAAASLRRAA